jgi:lysophospholipase L1-like esterase
MVNRRGISADRRWRASGIGAMILGAVVVMGALAVAHGHHNPPIPIASSAPLANQKPKKVLVIGDSFTDGTSSGGAGAKGWPQRAFRQLRKVGLDVNAEITAEGGSGYVARGSRGKTFGEKARSLLERDDDLVIVFGGTSDAPEKPELVAAAVRDTFFLVRKASPHAKLIAVGPASRAADPGPELTRVRDIVREAAAKINATFVDPIADQWFVGDPNLMRGLIREDGLHPTDVGHAYLADRLVPIIQRVLAPAASWS